MADDLVIRLFYPSVCLFCSVLFCFVCLVRRRLCKPGNLWNACRQVRIEICSPVVTIIDGIDDVPLYAVLVE